ncbi:MULTISPECIES: M6 family metalloprotease domain-containing protein [Streptomyces]|uniref:Secreted protein n=1 Tax=Streptomyces albus (strain ATCC 21838 / DSM 41398 / FERM P-419 / JCM 4703 / NBRC 107858) TaxID=1081613 RepID=A0A0B5EPP5_STRA4|nr:M6 family metalloprotease domain-containing protein [Streptomyces sp. SCSIO ZS0520]AJE84738.1 secreted protein [Streptomyces albus]AOU79043.1 secreted protein [Streptomyces albus]AYN34778.1 M6 family metalloprotease [Streptomyces albus]
MSSSRIRGARRTSVLAALSAFVLAATTSASAGRLLADSATAAGPVAQARGAALGPCMIKGSSGVQMSEGIPTGPGYARATGTVHALNLMVDFPDARGEGSALDRLAEFFPQTQEWFRTSSYGRLDYRPAAPVPRWLRMPKPFKQYGIERGAPFDPGYRGLVDDIVKAADPDVDFRDYDIVNIIATPNAGPSALDTVLSVTFAGNREAPVADGIPLSNTSFVYSRQDDGSGSYAETGYRVLPHENSHTFGLPDLYTQDGGGAAGHWDIMSEDWGADNDLLGWHKWKLGWLDDKQVDCAASPGTSDHTLGPLSRSGGKKMVFVPVSGTAGYAAEVHVRGGNDASVCRPGVLVYRVDADVDTGHGPIAVSDATEDSGGCTRSPNVHAELSDAAYTPGQTFTDPSTGVRISVSKGGGDGEYRVRVSRRG